ncbi:MAG: hypothetical protein ACREC2_08955, partial [Bradyrhizobium sp.]
NCGKAPELSRTRAFESHPALQLNQKIESTGIIKRLLPPIGQSSIFNLSAIFEISVGRTKRVRTPRRLSRQAKGGTSTASRAREPAIRGWQTAVIASEAKQSIVPHTTAMDCFVAGAPRNDGAPPVAR